MTNGKDYNSDNQYHFINLNGECMNYSKQRALILDIVKKNRVHPTAEWVFKEAKKQMLTIGIATVYRNLHALVEQGEIERIAVPGDMDRFDGYMEEHFHMKCIKCGSLVDLEPKNSQSVNKLKEMINTTFDVSGENAYLCQTLLMGVCNDCAHKKN